MSETEQDEFIESTEAFEKIIAILLPLKPDMRRNVMDGVLQATLESLQTEAK